MSRAALIESLRSRANEDVEAIWHGARTDAEAYRTELAGVLEDRRARYAQAAAEAVQRLEQDALGDAERRARSIRMGAMASLAGRLYALAIAELPGLRSEAPEKLFLALAAELPSRAWEKVKIHPGDQDLARRLFPQAELQGDETISGGMKVETEGGRIRVDNSLETRLATAWPEILPLLIAGLSKESAGHGPAA